MVFRVWNYKKLSNDYDKVEKKREVNSWNAIFDYTWILTNYPLFQWTNYYNIYTFTFKKLKWIYFNPEVMKWIHFDPEVTINKCNVKINKLKS